MPIFLSETFSHSASSSFGVVNRHLMLSCARSSVSAWSIDVLLVGLDLLHLPHLDQLDDPARIEVDHEADAAAVLGQVLDREAQPARPARADHQPVRRPSGNASSGSVSLKFS